MTWLRKPTLSITNECEGAALCLGGDDSAGWVSEGGGAWQEAGNHRGLAAVYEDRQNIYALSPSSTTVARSQHSFSSILRFFSIYFLPEIFKGKH